MWLMVWESGGLDQLVLPHSLDPGLAPAPRRIADARGFEVLSSLERKGEDDPVGHVSQGVSASSAG